MKSAKYEKDTAFDVAEYLPPVYYDLFIPMVPFMQRLFSNNYLLNWLKQINIVDAYLGMLS